MRTLVFALALALALAPEAASAAYSCAVTEATVTRAGQRYRVWSLVESDVGTTSECTLTGAPDLGAIVLVESELTTAGSATVVDPELGVAASWADDSIAEIGQNAAAATHVRIVDPMPFRAASEAIYWRSSPDANATTITSRIVARVGMP